MISPSARIVVVEDDPDHLALMVAFLERRYDVVGCARDLDALAVIEEARPEVVLLDIGLPHLAGPEILDRMRRSGLVANVPVVAVTADVRPDSEQHWLWRGFDAYLAKPIVDRHLLWATIDHLAGVTRSTRQ